MKINNNKSDEEAVTQVIYSLVEEKGIPEDEREVEKVRIGRIIEERMMDEILSALPTDKLEELRDLIKNDNFPEEKFDEIIENSGVKLESVAKKVLEEFREEYIGPIDESEEEK